ncbi:MAG: heterodisulfide reductase [Deltaproteobacteria bacterium CG_4_8_14_3_um_filter_51_11]|nr:MAG: heterodisulfide reductase [Desulfobacteraceae bacterium CG2_30_51_40]PIP46407.1 MAG: heterodisulfide reductase [Deltaproteobacteria bacterium CG23_combo_of_CG06-09_8_20_14_all_51_20]PIX18814.1 MAG: heterodisulfide reductase [Deltaproteobacteria bacterium CG_4_8_14_3_um_filter_51_11]PIY21685.1 MAG: heterodisulfide reductase [Deltaproteobacteria bacterium CG_4_10_14_3_um_filter_51_14]PJB35848.1 MAG: heterodisulfide reductase [Deltaproteobacteria bacterium CG_4_9_14_3_um_filter_51_14]
MTLTDVDRVAGEVGNFKVTLTRKPRYVIEDRCTGCTTCMEYCPVKYPDRFNQKISKNKAVHIYFAQAIPLIAYIDESCLYLKEKKCGICEGVCQNNAIDLGQTAETFDINVGAIILSAGLEPYDPSLKSEYGYGKMQNVVTSMDYERLLCSTGPYEGEILRSSDKDHPHKIAWIQCVGSRRVTPGDNSYCSAVCCTYAQKQVILTKDHIADAQCTIFHNDIRSFGKDFERYYEKTAALPGIRFIRSYASIVRENPETKSVAIRYSTHDDGVKEEEFDLVVLSVGLTPPAEVKSLAEKFGIELNEHRFCKVNPVNPMETSRPGIFVSGVFQGPTDIPESVFSASGAGSQCGQLLNYRRGKLTKDRIYPAERDVSQEEPRIGVFVCHCGANIGRIVNVPSTVEYALTLPNVVYAQEQLFSCATNSAKQITDTIKEKGLNRVIVAACSPRTLEPLFRDTLREAGINQYYYDMANIREHCSWVHSLEKEEATNKAQDIIRMSVARASHLQPLQEINLPVNKAVLVVGGGIAGITCSLSLAKQGHDVYLLEKDTDLGGIARRLHYTLEGLDVQAFLNDLIGKVYKHPMIHVYTGSAITDASGYIGNFVTKIKSERGTAEIKHGATIIATGADEFKPTEYLYGQDERVLTTLELEERIARGDEKILSAGSLVMIQCVGCRNEDRNYCARICCSHAIKNALKLKEINPQMDIHVLYRDMMTYGFREDYYREASDKDVKFVRYEPQDRPCVETAEEEGRPVLRVTVPDYILGKKLAIDADIVSLSAAVIPSKDNVNISQLFKVSLGPDDFFKEAHVKLRPVEFGTDGVYLCGIAHYPKHIPETINQSYGAAGRAITLLSRDTVTVSGSVCEVKESSCIGCGQCISACTYGAIEFRDTRQGKKAIVNPVICKGDGLCNAKCPTGAIQLKHFTDEELLSQVDAAA